VVVISGMTSTKCLKQKNRVGRVLESFTEEGDKLVKKLVQEIDVVERYMPAMMKQLNRRWYPRIHNILVTRSVHGT